MSVPCAPSVEQLRCYARGWTIQARNSFRMHVSGLWRQPVSSCLLSPALPKAAPYTPFHCVNWHCIFFLRVAFQAVNLLCDPSLSAFPTHYTIILCNFHSLIFLYIIVLSPPFHLTSNNDRPLVSVINPRKNMFSLSSFCLWVGKLT